MKHIEQDGRIVLSGCLVLNDQNQVLLLYRPEHKHYETPGGKVRVDDCKDFRNVNLFDLEKTALRELYEEIGEVNVSKLVYFGNVKFVIPNGRLAIANKFVVRILSGKPKIMEPEIFSRLDYISIDKLKDHSLSPDLRLLLSEIKKRLGKM